MRDSGLRVHACLKRALLRSHRAMSPWSSWMSLVKPWSDSARSRVTICAHAGCSASSCRVRISICVALWGSRSSRAMSDNKGDKDKKNLMEGLGDLDWDNALDEWEKNAFIPDVAKDVES